MTVYHYDDQCCLFRTEQVPDPTETRELIGNPQYLPMPFVATKRRRTYRYDSTGTLIVRSRRRKDRFPRTAETPAEGGTR